VDFGKNLREVTLLFLELIAEKYIRILMKNHGMNFIDRIIAVGFKIASEDPEIYMDEENAPPYAAINMLYAYACEVPTEKGYPIFEKYLQEFGTSKNEHERAAAVSILGHIADNDACLDLVRENVDPLTNFITAKMQDESKFVREAAGETVGRFAEHVVPDFLEKHKTVMPCLLKVIHDLTTAGPKMDLTTQKALFAMNEFVQNLDYDIKLYLEQIIQVLLIYVTGNYSRDIKYWALTCLTNTIGAAQKKILPFRDNLLQTLHGIITNQNTVEGQNVKGQALMASGKLASACGKEKFPAEALDEFTKFAMRCLKEDKANKLELKETAITFFADLAVILKEDLKPVFDEVMSEILLTCVREDEMR